MFRRAAREFGRRSEGYFVLLSECSTSGESLGLRALSTSSACHAKKRSKAGMERVQEQAADILNKPALVDGFSAVPSEPRFLGLAGALPFLMLSPPIAAGIPLMPADFVSNAAMLQIGYGASIASFLGGIHWALAMANYAWPAVTMQPGPGAFVAAIAIGSAYIVDRSFARRSLLPTWYMALRLPLTIAAVGGLAITCAASFTTHMPKRGAAVTQQEKPQQ